MIDEANERPAGLQGLAERHGVSLEAVRHLLRALEAGQGNMAQFDHPDLGGFGQWSRGGMVMVGRMNDHALKARVDSLCTELAAALPSAGFREGASPGQWWPDGLGQPASVGAQNATRYAYFPGTGRLAVETDGRLALYDTGGRVVTGASQQQGGTASFRFSGPQGSFSLDDLTPVPVDGSSGESPSVPASPPAAAASAAASASARPTAEPAPPRPAPGAAPGDVLTILERLADLRAKGVLTDAEFSAKKAELLARL